MRLRVRDLGISGAALIASVFAAGIPARAATIAVNSTADCDTGGCDGGNITLRMAIESVNAGSDQADTVHSGTYGTSDTIGFTFGSYPQTINVNDSLGGLPKFTKDVLIGGPGINNLIIHQEGNWRPFFVGANVNATITDLRIEAGGPLGSSGGKGNEGGGGGGAGLGGLVFVDSNATLDVQRVYFFDGAVSGGAGGDATLGSGGTVGGGGGGTDFHLAGSDGDPGSGDGGKGADGGIFGGTGGAGGDDTGSCPGTAAGDGTADGAGGGGGNDCTGAVGGDGSFGGGGGGGGYFEMGGAGGFGGGGGGIGDGVSGGPGGLFAGYGGESKISAGGGGGAGLGGAIFVRDGATLKFDECTFDSDFAGFGSGGQGNGNVGSTSGQNGLGKGGAIFAMDSATVIQECASTFIGNEATDQIGIPGIDDNNIYYLGSIVKHDTTNPVITCPPDPAPVANTPGLCSAVVDPGVATATDNCGIRSIVGERSDSLALTDPYPVGSTTITWTATDTSGNTAQCTQTIQVNDTELPVVSSSVSVTILTNDHTMKNVGYSESATDNCGGNLSGSVLVQIYSSEPEQAPTTGGGDGTTSPDARGRGTCYNSSPWYNQVALRQERLNNGSGRIYLIKTSATDGSNNTGWSCATVVSPRSNKKNDINKVLAAASAVKTVCNQFGAIPTNYYLIGCGPVIGSKQ